MTITNYTHSHSCCVSPIYACHFLILCTGLMRSSANCSKRTVTTLSDKLEGSYSCALVYFFACFPHFAAKAMSHAILEVQFDFIILCFDSILFSTAFPLEFYAHLFVCTLSTRWHERTRMHSRIHTRVRPNMHTNTRARTHVHTHTKACTYIQTHRTHTRTHLYSHTHLHTYLPFRMQIFIAFRHARCQTGWLGWSQKDIWR